LKTSARGRPAEKTFSPSAILSHKELLTVYWFHLDDRGVNEDPNWLRNNQNNPIELFAPGPLKNIPVGLVQSPTGVDP